MSGIWPNIIGMSRMILNQNGEDFLDYRVGSGDTVEIFDIVVNSERRKGRGRELIEQLFMVINSDSRGIGKQVWAITRADNLIAQQFYEALQFHVSGVLRRFYSSEKRVVDAILYCRHSKGPV